jgi:hypothetical protein
MRSPILKTGIATVFGFAACTAAADISGPISLPALDMFPEGIALIEDGTAYVGSLARGEIWKVDTKTGTAEAFIGNEADLMSVIGVYVNNAETTLYACSSDPAQQHGGRSTELVSFNLTNGSVASRNPFPDGGLCNDISELADGTILATDSVHPRIMGLNPDGSFSEWLRDEQFRAEGFSLNGIAVGGDNVFVGVFATGALYNIDASADTPAATQIRLNRPLAGPDGIEVSMRNTLIVVEGMAASVSRVRLSDDLLSGTVQKISEGFQVPTTVALAGDQAIVVQGQLGRFFGMDPSPVEPFELAIIPIAK